jgi:amino acid adenylation domain-containing protein
VLKPLQMGGMVQARSIERVVETYPLSPLQRGMLFHWLRDSRAGVDIEQISCTIRGVDLHVFRRAWEYVVRRQPVLRTFFRWEGVDVPMQSVADSVPLDIHEEDWRGKSESQQQEAFEAFISADRRRGFDFGTAPLFRLTFFRTSEHAYEFVWTFPHILLDGRSFVLVLRDVIETCRAFEDGREPAFVESRPYREFIDWLEQQDSAPAKEYWNGALRGFAEPVFPELGAVVRDASEEEYGEQLVRLTQAETAALREFVERHSITANTMVQAAWALVLSRYTGSDDIVYGATRASRRSALDGDRSVDTMVGLFINTLPVRIRVPRDQRVIDWLTQIREDAIAVRVAEHTALPDVQAASAVPSGTPLFDTMLVYEHEQQATTFNAFDSRFSNFRLREKTTFPLTLHAYGEAELLLRFEYYRSRFSDDAVARMLGHLANLLREMVAKGDGPIGALEMLSSSEHRLLDDWNDTSRVFEKGNATLTELLSAQAARTPEAIALESDDATMTYGELDARAHTLALALASYGVRPGVLVGVCMDRSFEMVVAMLGILKAGGAYVPIDPDYPAERLKFMLQDAQCRVLLTQWHIASGKLMDLPLFDGGGSEAEPVVIELDREWDRIVADGALDVTLSTPDPDDLAYMIYTSGSTGRPKGAINRNRGIVNLLLWMQGEYSLDGNDAVLQKTPASFDLSVPEFFLPLVAGARLVIAEPGGHRDPTYLARMMRDHGVTVLFMVPSMLRAFFDGDGASLPRSVRNVSCSGEALPYDLQESFLSEMPGARMYNLYGPTECAVEATYRLCERGDPRQIVPVGRPVANTRIYILDSAMQPVAIGVSGELFIAGVQVGAGYYRRDELTAERYLPDPFSAEPSARMYRTGDRARWLADGTIEYLGRLDFQIKLRGFRIEVGEIEQVLASHPAVRECAVVLRNDEGIEPRLVAYYVSSGGSAVSSVELRERLEEQLPSYMVPWSYVSLAAMPLSPSGKLDRKALPAPEASSGPRVRIAPRDSVEERVLAIWKQVIGAREIGVTDRFNEVGGNSLAAVRVFSRIAAEFSTKLQLVTILKHDTVEQLAALLREPEQAEEWQCIIPFTTGAEGTPIFCAHAQTGNVLIYQHFAKEVAAHHPVYGIQAYGNWGTQDPHESIEEMVDFYVGEILKVRPQGPYIFFGGSLGGYLALALAHAMRDRGHEVQMIVMYDTAGPKYPKYTAWGSVVQFTRKHGGIPLWRLRNILKVDRDEDSTLRGIYRNLRSTARWWYENTRRDYLYWKYEKKNPPLDFPMPANLTRVRLASRRAVRGHVPRYYPGKITYFRAKHQPEGSIHDPTNGWGGWSEELEIHHVPTGHTQGMSYPVVIQLSKTFLECVAALDAELSAR